MKVSVDGGEPEPAAGALTNVISFSPDGKLAAYLLGEEQGRKRRIAVAPAEGGEPVKVFDLPPGAVPWRMNWSPDGRALTYIVNRVGASNIWSQPLDGGAPRRLTDFKDEGIGGFAWSPDGSRLALSRGTATNDVVLISNFR
jgi:Tol biopolymer transport system component